MIAEACIGTETYITYNCQQLKCVVDMYIRLSAHDLGGDNFPGLVLAMLHFILRHADFQIGN